MSPFVYNPLAFDSDGDSLAYSLEVPMSATYSHTISPIPWTVPLSDSSGPFTLDPVTGIICWTPSTIGCYQFTVGVKEYRKGNLIGTMLRDFQVMIDAPMSGQTIPTLNQNACTPIHFSQPLKVGTNGSFSLEFSGVTPTTTFDAHGEPLLNGAKFSTTNLSNSEKQCTINWTPDSIHGRGEPYTVVIRVGDSLSKVIFGDYTITFNVGELPSIKEFQFGQAYPNPASQSLTIPVEMREPAELTLSLLDLLGKVVYQRDYTVNTGSTQVEMPVTVSDGIYLLCIQSTTGSQTQKISIQR